MSERSRRSAPAKNAGRMAALEKLRASKARGELNKANISDTIDSVYEELSEDKYAAIVRERQEDDWIVDDDGSGYVEDGREIFDEDESAAIKKGKEKKFTPKNRNAMDPRDAKKSLKGYFAQAPKAKGKREREDEDDDALLGEMLSELEAPKPKLKALPRLSEIKPKPRPSPSSNNPFSRAKEEEAPRAQSITFKPKIPVKARSPSPQPSPPPRHPSPEPHSEMREESPLPMDDHDVNEVEDVPVPAKTLHQEPEKETPMLNEIGNRGFTATTVDESQFESWSFVGEEDAKENVGSTSGAMADLPLVSEEGGEFLHFYWLDAFEDPHKHPGTAYLFGRVPTGKREYKSCCLTVRNLERVLYFLPREKRLNRDGSEGEELTFAQVHEEVQKILIHNGIKLFRAKKSEKKWAMGGEELPGEGSYLEVRFKGSLGSLPSTLTGETFSVVLGTTNTT